MQRGVMCERRANKWRQSCVTPMAASEVIAVCLRSFEVGFVTDGAGEKSLLMILMTHVTQMKGRKQRAAKAETEESQYGIAGLDAVARGKCERKVTNMLDVNRWSPV